MNEDDKLSPGARAAFAKAGDAIFNGKKGGVLNAPLSSFFPQHPTPDEFRARARDRIRDEFFIEIRKAMPCRAGSSLYSICEHGTCTCAQLADRLSHIIVAE